MKTIHVVTIGSSLHTKGGITSVIAQILFHEWEKEGIRMHFIPTYIEGGTVKKMAFFVCSYIRLFFYFLFGRPDIAHIHMSQRGSFDRKRLVCNLCRFFKIKTIIHLHASEFVSFYEKSSDRKKRKIKNTLTRSEAVITLGKIWEERVKRIAPDARTVILNNAVSLPETVCQQKVEEVSFLYLGMLIERKGVNDLLEAVKKLKENHRQAAQRTRFHIGGTGECETMLRRYVEDNGLSDMVCFHGWVEGVEKKELLSSCQVFVLPSYNEGLPVAILEALSYGMAVISSRVGSVEEAVSDGENGILYTAGDVDALYRAIESLSKYPDKRTAMAASARHIAETVFDERIFFDKLKSLYENFCA